MTTEIQEAPLENEMTPIENQDVDARILDIATGACAVLTLLWLLSVGTFIFNKGGIAHLFEMRLADLGSFFGGALGPVGFMWVVIGYLQQGRHLKHNSKALEVQSEELRRAVAKFDAIAEATRFQANLLKDEQRERRERERIERQMELRFGTGGHTTLPNSSIRRYSRKLINVGAPVTMVKVLPTFTGKFSPPRIPRLDHGEEVELSFEALPEEKLDGAVEFRYTDGLGRPGRYQIFVRISAEDGLQVALSPSEL